MAELNKRAWLEERYLDLYHIHLEDLTEEEKRAELEKLAKMDDATLQANVTELEECFEYLAGSGERKQNMNRILGT